MVIIMIINGSNLEKSYDGKIIFSGVSFDVRAREKIGLIGSNGSGKTTLMDIISGRKYPDKGQVHMASDLRLGYLEQNPKFNHKTSVYDYCEKVFQKLIDIEKEMRNLEVEMGQIRDKEDLKACMDRYGKLSDYFKDNRGYSYKSEIRGVLKGLGFSEDEFDKEAIHLSGGQKSRLHLASLLLQKPDVLLLDEPTNHLDMEAISFLEDFLINYQGTIILISHDRYFLDRVVNKIFHMEFSKLWSYNGNFSQSQIKRAKNLETRKKAFEKQEKEIARQEEIIERFSNYGRDRYKKQAESRKKMIEKMNVLDRPLENSRTFNLKFEPEVETGKDILSIDKLSKSYGNVEIFKNFSLNLYKGDKLGIIGDNGIGKSTLLKIILGQEKKTKGEIEYGSNLHIAYYDQNQDLLNNSFTVLDEILEEGYTISESRNILASFNFTGDEVFKEVTNLSGGERGRLSLLKLMLRRPNFIIMDEPTNHLDIDSKTILEDSINNFTGTVLVVSHDRYFLNQVCEKIIYMGKEGSELYYGNYDYYLMKTEQVDELDEKSGPSKTKLQKEIKNKNKIKKEKSKLNREIKSIERLMEEKNLLLDTLNEESYRPEVYSDYKKASEISEKIGYLKEEIEDLSNQWLEKTLEYEEYNDWI